MYKCTTYGVVLAVDVKRNIKFTLEKNCSRLIVNEVSVMNNPLICAYFECIFFALAAARRWFKTKIPEKKINEYKKKALCTESSKCVCTADICSFRQTSDKKKELKQKLNWPKQKNQQKKWWWWWSKICLSKSFAHAKWHARYILVAENCSQSIYV